jgi:hypothetical protein
MIIADYLNIIKRLPLEPVKSLVKNLIMTIPEPPFPPLKLVELVEPPPAPGIPPFSPAVAEL